MTHLIKFRGEYVLVDSPHSPQYKLFLNDLVSTLNGDAYPDECLTTEEKEYVSGRGGVGFTRYKHLFPNEIRNRVAEFTSLRDIFAFLPD